VPSLGVFRLTIPSQTKYLNLVTGLAKRASLVAGFDEDRQIDIEFRFLEKALEVRILHDGQGLRLDELVIPDAIEYVRHPRKGGLGLLLMSRFMDELSFQMADGRHECRMIKRLA